MIPRWVISRHEPSGGVDTSRIEPSRKASHGATPSCVAEAGRGRTSLPKEERATYESQKATKRLGPRFKAISL